MKSLSQLKIASSVHSDLTVLVGKLLKYVLKDISVLMVLNLSNNTHALKALT